jgi:hypothetical protein
MVPKRSISIYTLDNPFVWSIFSFNAWKLMRGSKQRSNASPTAIFDAEWNVSLYTECWFHRRDERVQHVLGGLHAIDIKNLTNVQNTGKRV